MHITRRIILASAVVIVAGGWYAFRPERAFIDRTVNESFAEPVAVATTVVDAAPTLVVSGNFYKVAHETEGTASIYQNPDGSRTLRFTGFETSNGPDVRVYLVAADDASTSEAVTKAGFVEVAPLKGNIGDQNYTIRADVDLSKYRAVTIWCKRFSVNFGTAPLKAAGSAM